MRVSVIVKPGSKSPGIEVRADGSLVVKVRERAIEGAANDAVTKALAHHYEVAPSRVVLFRGGSSRSKVFEIG